jgi:hypothetical protein
MLARATSLAGVGMGSRFIFPNKLLRFSTYNPQILEITGLNTPSINVATLMTSGYNAQSIYNEIKGSAAHTAVYYADGSRIVLNYDATDTDADDQTQYNPTLAVVGPGSSLLYMTQFGKRYSYYTTAIAPLDASASPVFALVKASAAASAVYTITAMRLSSSNTIDTLGAETTIDTSANTASGRIQIYSLYDNTILIYYYIATSGYYYYIDFRVCSFNPSTNTWSIGDKIRTSSSSSSIFDFYDGVLASWNYGGTVTFYRISGTTLTQIGSLTTGISSSDNPGSFMLYGGNHIMLEDYLYKGTGSAYPGILRYTKNWPITQNPDGTLAFGAVEILVEGLCPKIDQFHYFPKHFGYSIYKYSSAYNGTGPAALFYPKAI